jgi:hypothetical protein
MTRAQLQRLLDAHGAEPPHWPAAQRETAQRLIASDEAARRLLEDARRLDQTLRSAMQTPEVDAERLLAALTARPLPSQQHGLLARWWPAALARVDFAPAWPRVAVLASVAALGFAVGLTTVGDRIAADLTGAPPAAEDVALFDPDAITGLRP